LYSHVERYNLSIKLFTPFLQARVKDIDITSKVSELTLYIFNNVNSTFDFSRMDALKKLTIVYGFNISPSSLELITPLLNTLPFFRTLIIEASASNISAFPRYLALLNFERIKVIFKVIGLKQSIYESFEFKELQKYVTVSSVFNNIYPFMVNENIPLLVDNKKLFIVSPDVVDDAEIVKAWSQYFPFKISVFGNREVINDLFKIDLSLYTSVVDLSLSRINTFMHISLTFPPSLRSLSLSVFNPNPFPELSKLKIEELKINDCSTVTSLHLPTTLSKLHITDCERLSEIVDLNNELMRDLKISCPSVKMIVPYVARLRLEKYVYNKNKIRTPQDVVESRLAKQALGVADNVTVVELPTQFYPVIRKSFLSVNC
ncbi:hypothetical protein EIN_153670, partial [Entamoeba invadens IP1]